MTTTQTIEEKREDDAMMTWHEYFKREYSYTDMHPNMIVMLRTVFVAGYMEGRKDGKIGV